MPSTSSTYCFLDVGCTISGPGGTLSLGSGAGNAKEGITIEFLEDKDHLVTGADGSPMHSLIASKTAKISVRLLKTSPLNQDLAQMYAFQTQSSAFHGQNTITVTNPVTGDDYTCQACAFMKAPKNDYAEDGGTIEWDFNAGIVDFVLGSGLLLATIEGALSQVGTFA